MLFPKTYTLKIDCLLEFQNVKWGIDKTKWYIFRNKNGILVGTFKNGTHVEICKKGALVGT